MKKNILWIVTDQQRADSISINGSKNSSTPNIDMLARTGVNFTNAISGFPLCCPFRGSMLTSKYPHKCVPGHQYRKPEELPTIADVFNDNGYETYYVGKWHIDGAKEENCNTSTHIVPKHRRGGFDTWLGYENNNAQYDCYLHGHRFDEEISLFKLNGYETDMLTDLFIDFVTNRDKNAPFFAVVSVQPPHDPYVAPPKFLKNHIPSKIEFKCNVPDVQYIKEQAAVDLAGYYAMIENVDYNVGRIVDTLTELKYIEDTHIMYFSDHGDMHGSHGQFKKTTVYQEAIRIPFIISGETRREDENHYVGDVDNILINHVDIAPTSLGLCNIEIPDWMEGTDYSGVRLREKYRDDYPDSAYLQSVIPTKHPGSVNKPWRGIITSDGYKYACFENCDWVLFDLNKDPYEMVNLAHDDMYLKLRLNLREKLEQWIISTEDEFSLPE